ncbi:hypothetical protein MPL3356_490067 [Mesorhizobium plurifarium]|uniref:Uncharacterized protein n=1 Tax=Mesorhizobium plurifarium TaxID=69974 RepID=A0A090G1U9_MESPL|nr:hypothetical protein MPL3356_490067 [Mesorhizobium plurifarium]
MKGNMSAVYDHKDCVKLYEVSVAMIFYQLRCDPDVATTFTQRALLAIAGSRRGTHLQLYQPLGGKADHLAQDIGVGGLLHERGAGSSCRPSSVVPSNQVGVSNPTLPGNIDDRCYRRSLASALLRARSRAASSPPSYTTQREYVMPS